MRRIVDYQSDKVIGLIDDYPPLSLGVILRINDVNYRVMDISKRRRIVEIYVSRSKQDVHPFATPDYVLENKLEVDK